MALDPINLGSSPNDGTGDTLRAGGIKINLIISELWDTVTDGIVYKKGGIYVEESAASEYTLADFRNTSGNINAFANIFLGNDAATPYLQLRTSRQSGDAFIGNPADRKLKFFTNGLGNIRMTIDENGLITTPDTYNNTTVSAENMFIDSDGKQFRSTSSEKLKNILEPISGEYSSNIYKIAKETAIFYKSLCEGDNPDWTWYGLSAEKLAEIEPRLVHWGYWPEDYETLTRDIEVEKIVKSKIPFKKNKKIKVTKQEQYKVLKKSAKLSPVGVQYSRLVPLILVEMDRQNDKINELEKRLLKLENK